MKQKGSKLADDHQQRATSNRMRNQAALIVVVSSSLAKKQHDDAVVMSLPVPVLFRCLVFLCARVGNFIFHIQLTVRLRFFIGKVFEASMFHVPLYEVVSCFMKR